MMQSDRVRALGLCSGGLDSILAGVVLKHQGIDVTWISFVTPFFDDKKARQASGNYDIPLISHDITDTYMNMLKNPNCGYGKHMNPCRDCHSLMFRLAGQRKETNGYDFLFSGEVAGQRPLSQNKNALRYVEKNSGFDGNILRPLSATILPETPMEKNGLVDRSKLYGINGRSRKDQIDLAEKFGITQYPAPAGGCLLTEKRFSEKLKDLLDHDDNPLRSDLELLKTGRHIRLDNRTKIIVGRTQKDNDAIYQYHNPAEHMLLTAKNIASPLVLVPALADSETVRKAAAICIGYTKVPSSEQAEVIIDYNNKQSTISVRGLSKTLVQDWLI